MEADFSGYATKAGLKCSDGRTIMPDAFAHQDQQKVPLVWQHGHTDPNNVLGHAILENRPDGVYTYGFFNETSHGQSAKALVQHGDITMLSIFANQLVEKSKQVFHGAIREVSLVLAGANPGAKIDYVAIQHSDGDVEVLEDEAVIYTGLTLEHADMAVPTTEEDPTVQEVYDSLTEIQKEVVHFMIGAALESAANDGAPVKHSEDGEDQSDTESDDVESDDVESDDNDETDNDSLSDDSESDDTNEDVNLAHQEGTTDMTHNVFEQNGIKKEGPTLSHDQLKTIMEDAQKIGSFKEAFLAHTVEYGIEDIDFLFPDAKSISSSPELIARRMEWVAEVMDGTKHSPFSRIKSTAADLTAEEARAKGYVKGNKKKDEIIRLLKRVTTPTTVYKKQKLDRDDIVDITDLDVVAWLKAEMRLMLDEELARAVLIGDGREPDAEDKINEDHLRPIAFDDDMYAHKVTLASNVSPHDVIEAIIRARIYYKGTGTPTLFTTDAILIDLLLQEDKIGRRLYSTMEELAAALRVRKIVAVEVMEDTPDLIGILVNLADYTLGADSGGNISMFDDFDIDYNQYKYLIETRVSGALTKPKSAVVVRRTSGTVVTPQQPSYDSDTGVITIPSVTGVVYSINGTPVTGTVTITETTDVEATPDTGYSFPHNTDANWTYIFTD